jgi:hypothetical protein
MRLWTLRKGEAPVTIAGIVYCVGDPIEDGSPVLAELGNRVQILQGEEAAPAPAPEPAPAPVEEPEPDADNVAVEEEGQQTPQFTRKIWTVGGAEG